MDGAMLGRSHYMAMRCPVRDLLRRSGMHSPTSPTPEPISGSSCKTILSAGGTYDVTPVVASGFKENSHTNTQVIGDSEISYILTRMAGDEEVFVRTGVAANPNPPTSTHTLVTVDEDPFVAHAAKDSLRGRSQSTVSSMMGGGGL